MRLNVVIWVGALGHALTLQCGSVEVCDVVEALAHIRAEAAITPPYTATVGAEV
jgi:hypothetical protein